MSTTTQSSSTLSRFFSLHHRLITFSRQALSLETTPVFSRLPNEIIHLIFEQAALDSPESCRALCGVSSWARMLILPYHTPTIIIDSTEELDYFLNYPVSRPSRDWTHPLHYTRNLWINAFYIFEPQRDSKIFMPLIMERCPNLSNLALTGDYLLSIVESDVEVTSWDDADIKLTILPGGGGPERDHRLFITNTAKYRYNHRILHRITHLSIHNVVEMNFSISAFPRLTHLAVTILFYYPSNELLYDMLRPSLLSPTLQMLVMLTEEQDLLDRVACWHLEESKLYALVPKRDSQFTPQAWSIELEGEDLWGKAAQYALNMSTSTSRN